MLEQAGLHGLRIAEHQLGVQIGAANGGVALEQSKRTSRRAAGRATNELVHSRGKGKRTVLHVFAQFIPRFETIFARDDGLGIVQGEIDGA